jgi:hypothetical protein
LDVQRTAKVKFAHLKEQTIKLPIYLQPLTGICLIIGILHACSPPAENQPQEFSNLTKLKSQVVTFDQGFRPVGGLAFHHPDNSDFTLKIEKLMLHPETGDFFLLEQGSTRGVLRFDSKGHFIRQYGKRGEELDEYLVATSFTIDASTNQLIFMSPFKLFSYSLDSEEVEIFTLEERFQGFSDFATFQSFMKAGDLLYILIEELFPGKLEHVLFKLPTSLQDNPQEIYRLKVSKEENQNLGSPKITGDKDHIYLAYPPHFHIHHLRNETKVDMWESPMIFAEAQIPGWKGPIEFETFLFESGRIWFKFETEHFNSKQRIRYASGVIDVAEGEMTLFEATNLHQKNSDEIKEIRIKSKVVGKSGNHVFSTIPNIKHQQSHALLHPELPCSNCEDRAPDIVIYELQIPKMSQQAQR